MKDRSKTSPSTGQLHVNDCKTVNKLHAPGNRCAFYGMATLGPATSGDRAFSILRYAGHLLDGSTMSCAQDFLLSKDRMSSPRRP